MHILTKLKKELASAVEEAGYTEEQWKELDEKTKKQYIKDHPNSKYAQKDKQTSPQKSTEPQAQKFPSKDHEKAMKNVIEYTPLFYKELEFEGVTDSGNGDALLKWKKDGKEYSAVIEDYEDYDPEDDKFTQMVADTINSVMDDEDYGDDDEVMTTEQAKHYWDKQHNSDPILREYTSYEDWYKDSKENGYIKDEYKPENNSVRPTSYFNGNLEIEYWDEEPSGGYFTDNAAYIGQDIEDNFGDEVDIKFADDGNSNFVSILDKKTGEIYNVVIDDHGIDVMNKDMTDSYAAEETENGYFEPDDLDSVVQFIKKKVSGDEDEVDYTEEEDDYDFTSDEPMTTEEAKKYWKENRTSDPLLEMYDSFEEWYKDSKENGYIED